MISWILSALGASLSDAFHNLFIKKQTRELDTYTVSWIRTLWIAIILSPLVLIFPAHTSKLFWEVLIVRTVLDTVATVLYVSAIKRSDLSLVLPLIAFTPLFVAVIEAVFFKSHFSVFGLAGIMLVVLGTYLLNFERGESRLAPFRNLFRHAGSRMMLCVAIIWSVTSTLHTVAIRETNPYFYGGVSALFIVLLLSVFMLFMKGFRSGDFKQSRAVSKNALPGVLGASSHIFQMVAQSMAPASYVIAVKRTSILFTSILAFIFLGESLRGRFWPAILSTLGVIFIAISLT